MSEIKRLWETLEIMRLSYPLVDMEAPSPQFRVEGKAFFPIGRGLLENGDETVSNKLVMILGQDFGTVEYFQQNVRQAGTENTTGNPTWNNLLTLLDASGIDHKSCFFTNAIMGLRKTGKNTDSPVAFKNPTFIAGCQQFFLAQIQVQRPRVILALGYWPAHFLSHNLSPMLTKYWGHFRSITPIVAEDSHAVVLRATFPDVPDYETNVVALFHPSMRGVNVSKLSKNIQYTFTPQTEADRIRRAFQP